MDIKQLAKTELHCHLDGSISLETIRVLADMAGIAVAESDSDLKKCVTAPAETASLVDYLRTFDFVRPLLQTKEALSLAVYDVARQQAEDNVLYSEIRFAPELSMDQGLSASETVQAVLEGLHRAQTDFGIVSKVLVCGMRQSAPQITVDIFEHVIDLAQQGFVGFDFAGDEHGFPPSEMLEGIKYVQSLGLPMTFHAGECGCAHHISDSIALGIKRLGHVTAIHNHPEIIEAFVEQGVTAELCLTSNLQTKAAATLEDFPYLELKAAGANITINTDNRTVSDTNLNKEYALFVDYFGTSAAEFFTYNEMAIRASFSSQEEKDKLLVRLAENYQPFL